MKTPTLLLSGLAFATTALAGSLNTRNTNGETVVEWNGKEVWKGTADGGVRARSSTVDGREYAAVLAGDKVLWENEPGAAAKAGAKIPAAPEPGTGKEDQKSAKSEASVSTTTKDGTTIVNMGGKEVWKGKTSGPVKAKSVSIAGATYSAVFEGDKVLWESSKGAAEKAKKQVPHAPALPEPPKQ